MPYNRLQNELYARARALIEEGRLSCSHPVRMWGGKGSGLPCALCAEVIPLDQVEYELEYEVSGGNREIYRFHFLCHAAWQVECARKQTVNRQSP